ncbi:MAG: aldo/keto reductase [Bacteroidota bacterium]
MLKETFKLANGIEIPKIGLGTWQIPNKIASAAVHSAIKVGYSHIDTAAAYKNESGVALGIKQSGIFRNNIFITTKIPAEIKTYNEAKNLIAQSLINLNTDYINLMLIHAPKPWSEMATGSEKMYFKENIEVWRALEEAYKTGIIKAIGVSNFEKKDIQNILENCEIVPLVNQVRFFIGDTPEEILKFCSEHKILVEGYSPIATGRLLTNNEIRKIADKYSVTIPQLCIKYILQRGALPLPKTTHVEFMIKNAQVDFVINEDDMKYLNAF